MWTLICHVTFSVRIYNSLPSGNHLTETSMGGLSYPLVIPLSREKKKEEERESPVMFPQTGHKLTILRGGDS